MQDQNKNSRAIHFLPRTITLISLSAGAAWLLLTALVVLAASRTTALVTVLISGFAFIGLTIWLLRRLQQYHGRDTSTLELSSPREIGAQTESIIAALGDAVSIQAPDFRVLYQNPLHKTFVGGDHQGEYCYKAYRNMDRICDNCHLALSFKDGLIHKAEQTRITGKGTMHYEIISSPLKDASGKIIACIEAVRDITDRKRTEEAVRTSEKRYRTLFENAGDAIFILDAEGTQAGRIRDANQAAASMHGYTVQELLAMKITDLDSSDAAKLAHGRIRQILDGEWIHAEISHRRKDGTVFPVEMSAGLLELENERYILAIDRDVSERKTAEAFRKNILEAVDEAFIVIDRNYTVLSANSAYGRQVQLPIDQINGRPCYEISHHRQAPCWQSGEDCAVKRAFESGCPQTALHIHQDQSGGAVYVETKAFPMTNEAGQIVSAIEIINDVTAKKKLEEQLRHAQKMEAIGTLTGGIAHDFNNILTTILGYSSFALKKMTQDDPLRHAMDNIFSAAQRASNLTRSLLAFSRKQPMKIQPEDLNSIVSHLEKLLLRVIGEDIELITDLAAGEATVMVDRGQMEQVLMNLCTNARDAMPEGGVLLISTSRSELDLDASRTRGLQAPGTYATLTVADTGVGIDPNLVEKIFDPFFTTKEVGKGTGLGLSIVYGIIRRHHGDIEVDSEPGKGTTFRIILPLIGKRTETANPPVIAEPKGGKETVLVAEDDDQVRNLVLKTLTESGYTVIDAANGEEAVRKFNNKINLLILDVVMPKKNGREAYEEIRKMRPGIKVIFMSGYTPDVIRRKGILTEDIDFLSKPLIPHDLIKRVREVLR